VEAEVRGRVAPGFEPVREAFARCFAELGETGAAVAADVDGQPVADLWGGWADAGARRAWRRDTVVNVFSAGKPPAALCVLRLVDRGALELDARVADVWPKYGRAGKEATTVRHVLAHQAGLVALRDPQPAEALLDWERMTALLAAEPPAWEPGTRHGEHALFYGHLVGELVRRVDGRRLGAFWRDEVARPLGLDLGFGLGPAQQARAASLVDPGGAWRAQALADERPLYRAALDNPPGVLDVAVVNSAAWRAAEIPAVNAHADARALARLYGTLATGGERGGVRVLGPEALAEATRSQASGRDEVLAEDLDWGLGVALDTDGFGLGGIGGSLGWADPDLRLGFGYVTARMGDHDRAEAVYEAVRRVAIA
jgi:CubicO group peptidase (beta-lactamase class C family)